jgi:AI-2 transport protein TqsA
MEASPKPRPLVQQASNLSEQADLHPVKGPVLTEKEKYHDERIRTLCFVMMACAVLYYLVLTLRDVLVPFFLALAIKYVLTPLINVISCRHHAHTVGRWRLHRGFAIFVAMMLAAGMLSILGLLVVRSVAVFASKAGTYSHRLADIVEMVFAFVDEIESHMHSQTNATNATEARGVGSGMRFLQSQLDTINVGDMISLFLDHAAEALENMIYILLFLVFMLVGESELAKKNKASDEAEQQIYVYIRGKLSLSCLVASAHGLTLWAIGCELWLVFFVLTFSLNFVPNIGMFIAVFLPMPLVALDPDFTVVQIACAFLVPGVVGVISKDVLEPLLIGNSTSLQPVALMLAIMIWGSVWGLTGMILAVPMTAVLRIHLSHIEHPLTRYVASALDGSDGKYKCDRGEPDGTTMVPSLL